MSNTNDNDISQRIASARSRPSSERGKLLDSYRNYLWMLARARLDSQLRAKVDQSDLVQDTLIKAHDRFEQFRGTTESELASWLRTILARELADVGRKFHGASRQLSRERSLEDALGSTSLAFGKMVADSGASPSEIAGNREAAVVLADALAELPVDHREVIILISLEELDLDTVAEKMNRSKGAVTMLWTRALKRLKPLIQKRLEGNS